jgi:hypothetical protein
VFSTPGLRRLKATRAGAVRSNALEICVGDSACQSTLPAPRPPVERNSIDKIAHGDRYARAAGPRILRGRVAKPAGGVAISLAHRAGARCSNLVARHGELRPRSCASKPTRLVPSVTGGDWRYALSPPLPPGSYVLTLYTEGRAVATRRFSIASAPRHAAGARRAAARYLVSATEVGGLGPSPRQSPTALTTGWGAIALAALPRTPSQLRAVRRARRALHRFRVRSLGDAIRTALAFATSRRSADRRTLDVLRTRIAWALGAQGTIGRDPNATAYAVVALGRSHPRAARRARRWLVRNERPGGGFGAGAADADTTGAVLWALGRRTPDAVLARAVRWLQSVQSPDGGLPQRPGAASNSQSTALTIVGLESAGGHPRALRTEDRISPVDYLRARLRRGGSIAYARGDARTPIWVTAQALLALGFGIDTSGDDPARRR